VASPAEVFQELREAHAKADADGAAALYAPDAVLYGPDNAVHRGRDEIRNHLASYFANRGPVEVTVKRQVANASVVLAEWTSAYTQGGRRWSGTPGVSVLEFGHHGISYQRDYQ
jgi:uncharacterized protein (TIGR02246 family)